MANGRKFATSKYWRGRTGIVFLDEQEESSDGIWMDVSSDASGAIEIIGLEAGGSIEIHVSIQEDKPADSDGGLVKYTFTSISTIVQWLSIYPCRFMKIKKVAGGSPTKTTVPYWGSPVEAKS